MRNNEGLRPTIAIKGKRRHMTLIVVLACKDGIVFASDGLVSEMIEERYPLKKAMSKIKQVGKDKLLCGCGHLSLIQEITKKVKDLPPRIFDNSLADEGFYKKVCKISEEVKKEALERFLNLHGPERRAQPDEVEIVVAEYRAKKPVIFHVSNECRGVFVESGYGCYGESHSAIAANALIKYHPVEKLDVSEGVKLIYKAVKFGIDAGLPHTVGEPIDIWTITDEGIREKTKTEIEELRKTYESWIRET